MPIFIEKIRNLKIAVFAFLIQKVSIAVTKNSGSSSHQTEINFQVSETLIETLEPNQNQFLSSFSVT